MEIQMNVLMVFVLLSGVGATLFDHSTPRSFESSNPSLDDSLRMKMSSAARQMGPHARSLAPKRSAPLRLLCLVNTTSSRHDLNAAAVKFTWGRRCNFLVFASDDEDSSLPAFRIHLNHEPIMKTKESLKYVYERYRDKFDWVLRAEDSTYVIVENLRHFLSPYDPSKKFYMGSRLHVEGKGSFMSSRAGYVLSRAAVEVLVETEKESFPCPQTGSGIEDLEMSQCLEKFGVEMVDTRDPYGRHRFLHYALGFTGLPSYLDDGGAWMSSYSFYPIGSGFDCCSDTLISNYYPHSSTDLYLFEYLLYKVGKTQMSPPHAAAGSWHHGSASPLPDSPTHLITNTTVLLKLVVRGKRKDPQGSSTHPQKAQIYLPLTSSDEAVPRCFEPSQMQRLEPNKSAVKLDHNSARRVRLLCLVVVTDDHEEAIQLQSTWGLRCTHLVFLSYKEDPILRSVVLNTTRKTDDDYEFGVVKEAFKFVYDNYLDRIDWVLKVNQHSYVVVDNLIPLLAQQDQGRKLYVGSRMKNSVRSYYVSSEAGYVLSREAVRAFVEEGLSFNKFCREDDGGEEDIEMGECLHNVGVEMVDTRDSFGSHTFLPSFESFAGLVEDKSVGLQSYYPVPTGLDCCSRGLISINSGPVRMFEYEFLLFRLKNFGLNSTGL